MISATSSNSTSSHLPSALEAQLRLKAKELTLLPSIAIQAMEITKHPEASIREFTSVVERDATLAADVLKMANSVMYSPGHPILNLNQAVLRLGFAQCKNLILNSSMATAMRRISMAEEWVRESLCRHGFVTALISTKLNLALNVGFHGEEFTAGLMHDFGRTLFATYFPEEFLQIDKMTFEENEPDFLENERLAMEADHCQIGAWFAEKNGLPESLVEAIRYHHTPEHPHTHQRLTALTAISDNLANNLQVRGAASDGSTIGSEKALSVLESTGLQNATSLLRDVALPIMDIVISEADQLIGF